MGYIFLIIVIIVLCNSLVKLYRRIKSIIINRTKGKTNHKSTINPTVKPAYSRENTGRYNNNTKKHSYRHKRNDTEITLSEEQIRIYNAIEFTSNSYFITGKAGTGKSVLLQYFVNHTSKKVIVLAPTGIAALLVGGQTIHSFFELNIGLQDVNNKKYVNKISGEKGYILKCLDTLIIDEASMICADVMDMIDSKLQKARNNHEPFGGCQIVLFGDLYQLPPVVDNSQLYRIIEDRYKTKFFFGAPGIERLHLNVIELQKVFRQNDPKFIDLLNKIRVGEVDDTTLAELNSRCVLPPKNEKIITLTAHNKTANDINTANLNKLFGKEFIFNGLVAGDFTQSALPAELHLRLKVGALVMMVKNDIRGISSDDETRKARWVNGTLGIISYLSNDIIKVMINGVEHIVEQESWEKYQYKYDINTKTIKQEVVGTFIQYPIKVAYAITIHKSQGQTYDKVRISLGTGAFEDGQVYAAISRCRDFQNIYLDQKISLKDIKVNPEIKNFMMKNPNRKLILESSQCSSETVLPP